MQPTQGSAEILKLHHWGMYLLESEPQFGQHRRADAFLTVFLELSSTLASKLT